MVSAAANGQAVRQAAVPIACMTRHMPVCMAVADDAAGGVVISISIGNARVSRSPSICCCCCMLLPLLLRCYLMLLLVLSLLLLRPASLWWCWYKSLFTPVCHGGRACTPPCSRRVVPVATVVVYYCYPYYAAVVGAVAVTLLGVVVYVATAAILSAVAAAIGITQNLLPPLMLHPHLTCVLCVVFTLNRLFLPNVTSRTPSSSSWRNASHVVT